MKTKRAAKKKNAAKKAAKKGKRSKKELHPDEVRKDISLMVEAEAAAMAQAALEQGKQGQLASMKYLLELANIFPPTNDGSQASAEEESLAETLLHRLDLPDKPIARDDEDEDDDIVVIPAKEVVEPAAEETEPEPAKEETPETAGVGGTIGEEASIPVLI